MRASWNPNRPRRLRSSLAATGAAVAVLVAVSGCGGSGKPSAPAPSRTPAAAPGTALPSPVSSPTTSSPTAAQPTTAPPTTAPPTAAPTLPPPASARPTPAPPTLASSAGARPTVPGMVVAQCTGKPVVEPADFQLDCAHHGEMLEKLTWMSWGASTAVATGVLSENTCEPSCADGRFQSYSAVVTVTGLRNGAYTLLEYSLPQDVDIDATYGLTPGGPEVQTG